MSGLIGTRQVVSHFGTIWREFGPRCAVRCVGAIFRRRPTTFLDVAFETSVRRKTRCRRRPARSVRTRPAI
jgi:hypothetical protein